MAARLDNFRTQPRNNDVHTLLAWENFCFNNLKNLIAQQYHNKKVVDQQKQTNELLFLMSVITEVMEEIQNKLYQEFHLKDQLEVKEILEEQALENQIRYEELQKAYQQLILINNKLIFVDEQYKKAKELIGSQINYLNQYLAGSNLRLSTVRSNISVVSQNIENGFNSVANRVLQNFPLDVFHYLGKDFLIEKEDLSKNLSTQLKALINEGLISQETLSKMFRKELEDLLIHKLRDSGTIITRELMSDVNKYLDKQTDSFMINFNNDNESKKINENAEKLTYYKEVERVELKFQEKCVEALAERNERADTLNMASENIGNSPPENAEIAIRNLSALVEEVNTDNWSFQPSPNENLVLEQETLDTSFDFLNVNNDSEPFGFNNNEEPNNDDPFGAFGNDPAGADDPFGVLADISVPAEDVEYPPPAEEPFSDPPNIPPPAYREENLAEIDPPEYQENADEKKDEIDYQIFEDKHPNVAPPEYPKSEANASVPISGNEIKPTKINEIKSSKDIFRTLNVSAKNIRQSLEDEKNPQMKADDEKRDKVKENNKVDKKSEIQHQPDEEKSGPKRRL